MNLKRHRNTIMGSLAFGSDQFDKEKKCPTCENVLLKRFFVYDTSSNRTVYRGSYMNAHVFLNLLNELRKSDKM